LSLREKAKKIKDAFKKATGNAPVWDMSTKEAREWQVKRDFEAFKANKSEVTLKFVELNDYYHNRNNSIKQAIELAESSGATFIPPGLPEAFIHVESQIDPDVPDFEFKGRDVFTDPQKAKEREEVCRYVCYINDLETLVLENERPLKKVGCSFFKVSWDDSIQGPGIMGDIVIGNPPPTSIFPDGSAYDIDDCEALIYAFRTHRRKAMRMFPDAEWDRIPNDGNHHDTEVYRSSANNSSQTSQTIDDDTVQIIEYWYRDNEGDIACSIQINNIEVKWIEKYWINTRHSGNKMYPFAMCVQTPVEQSFWPLGEIETIQPLIDAADREFMTAIMNDALMANDIVIREENALVDGNSITNVPGSEVIVKTGMINAVRRLGGLKENNGLINTINFIHDKIQETNGNFATKGAEPQRITTASGLAQLREDRESRSNIKKAGRLLGFKRLYQLIDWSVLEFYNIDRYILIRGQKEGEQDQIMTFNSENYASMLPNGETYYPKIDVEISAIPGIAKSTAFNLQALQELARLPINPQNVHIVLAIIDLIDMDNKQEIKESILQSLQPQTPPGEEIQQDPQAVFDSLPQEIKEIVSQLPPDIQEAFLMSDPETQTQMIREIASQVQGGVE